jgi:hypothetical protein
MDRHRTAPTTKQAKTMASAVDTLVYLAMSDVWSGMLKNPRRIAGMRWE